MPEEHHLSQEIPPAEGSATDEWVPTKEAAKLVGASARTLKRRADLGNLRRTSVHTPFGVENRYNKKELEKLKRELFKRGAEVIAEGLAELGGRRADGAEGQVAGGDTRALSVADHAEVSKMLDQKITKITEPFFKLIKTLETGFGGITRIEERTAKFQERMIRIETARDREQQEDREGERLKVRVIIICYALATLAALGMFGYLFWLMHSGKLFGWKKGWGRGAYNGTSHNNWIEEDC